MLILESYAIQKWGNIIDRPQKIGCGGNTNGGKTIKSLEKDYFYGLFISVKTNYYYYKLDLIRKKSLNPTNKNFCTAYCGKAENYYFITKIHIYKIRYIIQR